MRKRGYEFIKLVDEYVESHYAAREEAVAIATAFRF